MLLLGRLEAAEPSHEPCVVAAPCSPGGMSSICWSKPHGRCTCERPTGRPMARGTKVRDCGGGVMKMTTKGKIKLSRALFLGAFALDGSNQLARGLLP